MTLCDLQDHFSQTYCNWPNLYLCGYTMYSITKISPKIQIKIFLSFAE